MYMDNEQLDNLINMAIDKIGFIETMIVEVRYKYSWETEWTVDNQILRVKDGDKFYWQNDWYEGQEDVEYTAIIPLTAITPWRFTESEDRLISSEDAKSAINVVLESCNNDEFYERLKECPKITLVSVLMTMQNCINSLPSYGGLNGNDDDVNAENVEYIKELEEDIDKFKKEIEEHKRHIAELKNVINDR